MRTRSPRAIPRSFGASYEETCDEGESGDTGVASDATEAALAAAGVAPCNLCARTSCKRSPCDFCNCSICLCCCSTSAVSLSTCDDSWEPCCAVAEATELRIRTINATNLMKTLHGALIQVRHFENENEFQFQLGMLRAALLECQEIENQEG